MIATNPGDDRGELTLALDTRTEDGSVVVRVEGEMDIATSDELHDGLDRAVGLGHGPVVLEADGVEFIDSTALRVLVAIHHRLEELGRTGLVIRDASPAMQRVLTISGLADIFAAPGAAAD